MLFSSRVPHPEKDKTLLIIDWVCAYSNKMPLARRISPPAAPHTPRASEEAHDGVASLVARHRRV